jgi:hypothetical protein
MQQILIRFVIGGLVVSLFSVFGSLFKPKSFAGLFGAAPSVALATLGLTVATEGHYYAAQEARSMILGAIAFFAYATCVLWGMIRGRQQALAVTLYSMPLWLSVAFGLWFLWLRKS